MRGALRVESLTDLVEALQLLQLRFGLLTEVQQLVNLLRLHLRLLLINVQFVKFLANTSEQIQLSVNLRNLSNFDLPNLTVNVNRLTYVGTVRK